MNSFPTPTEQPKKSNRNIIIAVVVVIILCCCCCIAGGGYYYMQNKTSSIFSSINQQLQMTPGGSFTDPSNNPAVATAEAMATAASGNPAVATAEAMATAAAQGTLPAMNDVPTVPAIDVPTVSVPSNLIPQGGLGDDVLRTDAWSYVIAAAAMKNCIATDPTKVSIDVTQKPDSAGIWIEKWTVTCSDSTKAAFAITFTPSKSGGTDISVTESK